MKKQQLAIIGSGPAGFTAAIYAARDKLNPVIFTGIESGGQLMYTSEVENFPGFPEGILGPKLMADLRAQAERFGADIQDSHITAVDLSTRPFKLWTKLPAGTSPEVFKNGSPEEIQKIIEQAKQLEPDFLAESLIISTGATAITLKVPGEEKLLGRGVSTCAVCDAPFYKDKQVFVVGGGDSAMEDSLALTKFASQVTIIHRRSEFSASKIMAERVLANKKITVLWNTTLEEIIGESAVEKIAVNENGERKEYPAQGLFYAIGHRPVTDLFQGQLELEKGYIVTAKTITKSGLDLAVSLINEKGMIAYPSRTSVDGVFAAGDVVDIRYRQAITAAGQGCEAALDAERWLENL
ncbi:MAG: FAD-dependent oxidoreductase [Candidatus Paceibacterota bacterium]